MAQPEYVPVIPRNRVRVSERLPTPEGWVADRVAEVRQRGSQPTGRQLGVAGPDQGYALKLARHLRDRIVLGPADHLDDVVAGCVGVALRRAARYGRAPVLSDVELGLAVWGFLGEAPGDLAEFRRPLFESAAHHYNDLRAIADRVPAATLELTPGEVQSRLAHGGWRVLLGVEG